MQKAAAKLHNQKELIYVSDNIKVSDDVIFERSDEFEKAKYKEKLDSMKNIQEANIQKMKECSEPVTEHRSNGKSLLEHFSDHNQIVKQNRK